MESNGRAGTGVKPGRAFVDPITQLRNLVRDDYQFRREAASFMRYLTDGDVTTLFTTQLTSDGIVPGEPLRNLRGILTGTPEFADDE